MKNLLNCFIIILLLMAAAFVAGMYVEWEYEFIDDILTNFGEFINEYVLFI